MNTKTILIVEDDPAILSELSDVLMMEGFECLSANNGLQAVELLSETVPDLVISDWLMPKMHGSELLTWMKNSERLKDIPVVMLSAKADEHFAQEIINKGAEDYLTKPIAVDKLINCTKKYLTD